MEWKHKDLVIGSFLKGCASSLVRLVVVVVFKKSPTIFVQQSHCRLIPRKRTTYPYSSSGRTYSFQKKSSDVRGQSSACLRKHNHVPKLSWLLENIDSENRRLCGGASRFWIYIWCINTSPPTERWKRSQCPSVSQFNVELKNILSTKLCCLTIHMALLTLQVLPLMLWGTAPRTIKTTNSFNRTGETKNTITEHQQTDQTWFLSL